MRTWGNLSAIHTRIRANASKIWLGLVLAIFLGVKLFQLTEYHLPIWDEAVYVGMGKWLFSGGSVGLWEPIRPLLFPVVLGFYWWLGLPVVLMGEITQVLVGAAILVLTYLIAMRVFNWRVGILASLTLSIYPIFFQNSNLLLVETTSTLFVLLALYSFICGRAMAAGVFAGLAFLTRFPQGLVLPVLMFACLGKRGWWKRAAAICIGFGLICIPFLVFNLISYSGQGPIAAMLYPLKVASVHQSNPFEAAPGNWWQKLLFYFTELTTQSWLFLLILPGLLFTVLYRLFRQQKVRLMLIMILLYIMYYTYIINKQTRFAISFLPVACIFIAYGGFALYHLFAGGIPRARFFFTFICLAVLLLLLVQPIKQDLKYIGWRYKSEPPIVEGFYRYFETHKTYEAILTADPVPAAYTDALFIPAYNNVSDGLSKFGSAMGAGWIIFKLSPYPCLQGDLKCASEKDEMVRAVSRNQLIYTESFFGETYQIYHIVSSPD